jgi:hypothetical protein
MDPIIASLDAWSAAWFPPFARVCIWASVSAAFSMAMYAWCSPAYKIMAITQQQKAIRREAWSHDGDFDSLWQLIRQDLILSLHHMRLVSLPFLFSLLPIFLIFPSLLEIYTQSLTYIGPSWAHGFEFWYITLLIAVSLIIKILFKIP